jgi:4-hydroxy-tetrahydrodipicolinate synthase
MKPLTTRNLSRPQLAGTSIVPMLTPFLADGRVDAAAIPRLVEHILAGGSDGIMVCGTTGEFASMSVEQRCDVLRLATAAVAGRGLVFAGIGDTSQAHSLCLADEALRAGADALVANLPSYYPLTDTMMERSFASLADAVPGPLYLYNIPQTTRHTIPLAVIERLSHHPRIAGIKDSEPDGDRLERLAAMFRDRPDFAVFCGSIAFSVRTLRAGADGIIPGAGNFAPARFSALLEAVVEGRYTDAEAAQQGINALNATYQKGRTISQLFSALKAILEIHGLCGRHVLPPLLPASDEEVEAIRRDLQALGVVS